MKKRFDDFSSSVTGRYRSTLDPLKTIDCTHGVIALLVDEKNSHAQIFTEVVEDGQRPRIDRLHIMVPSDSESKCSAPNMFNSLYARNVFAEVRFRRGLRHEDMSQYIRRGEFKMIAWHKSTGTIRQLIDYGNRTRGTRVRFSSSGLSCSSFESREVFNCYTWVVKILKEQARIEIKPAERWTPLNNLVFNSTLGIIPSAQMTQEMRDRNAQEESCQKFTRNFCAACLIFVGGVKFVAPYIKLAFTYAVNLCQEDEEQSEQGRMRNQPSDGEQELRYQSYAAPGL